MTHTFSLIYTKFDEYKIVLIQFSSRLLLTWV